MYIIQFSSELSSPSSSYSPLEKNLIIETIRNLENPSRSNNYPSCPWCISHVRISDSYIHSDSHTTVSRYGIIGTLLA